MSLSDEERAAQIIADKLEDMMQRLGLLFIWSTRMIITGALIAGRAANVRTSGSVHIPGLTNHEKLSAREIAEEITDFGEG